MICDPMENNQATKRNEVLIHATIWMNPENIMLNEKKRQKSDISYDSIYIQNRYRKQISVCQEVGVERKGGIQGIQKNIFLFYFFKVMRNSGIR